MKSAVRLERVETSEGIVKIEGEVFGSELTVQKLWAMSTDGWEEIAPKCSWAESVFTSNNDIFVGRSIRKYGSIAEQVTRVVGS